MSQNRTPQGLKQSISRPDHGKIYIGYVKDNKDVQRMGRLSVWIPELGGKQEDSGTWIPMSYASPFAGSTPLTSTKKGSTTMDGAQQSYGFWMVPPDLDNMVLCCFINGETAQGYWFACIYQQNMNHMVPGIASDATTDPNVPIAPVVEYNKQSNVNPSNPPRPIFTPLYDGLKTEGLSDDYERGPSSTSARREAPSQVFGFNTPRGNTIHIDDNNSNEFIRLRTRSGAQVMISETTGFVYINSKDGNSWVEISDSGIDIYTKKSISMRAEENFNIHADKNINFYAGQGINITAAGGDINQAASGNLFSKTGSATQFETGSQFTIKAGTDILSLAGGLMRQQSAGDHTIHSGANIIRYAETAIQDNVTPPPDTNPTAVVSTPSHSAIDIQNGGHTPSQTTVPRYPTHEPWSGHPNSKVPAVSDPNVDLSGLGMSAGGHATKTVTPTTTVQTGSGKSIIVNKPYTDNSPKVTIGKYHPSETVVAAIKKAAAKVGPPVTEGYMMAMAAAESGFNPNAQAGSSSASGLYQFTDGTWTAMVNKYGASQDPPIGLDDRFDPEKNAMMAALFTKDNADYLQNKGIDPVGDTELYTAHFMGSAGAASFLKSDTNNPDGIVGPPNVSQSAINANSGIFQNGDGTLRSNSQVYTILQNKIVPNSTAYATANTTTTA